MSVFFLQAGGAGGAIGGLLPILMIMVVFYFFMIRPQQKRQKEQNTFSDSLEKGKEVVTASGIIGKINKIEDNVITLQIANGVFIRVTKNSISKEMTEAFASGLKDETNA